ncbi:MAG: hypothetical protein WCA39_01400 [Nitrososphaeraceae archaeon]
MADEDTNSQRSAKAEERKEEVIKAQTPGPKTAQAFRQEASDKKGKKRGA